MTGYRVSVVLAEDHSESRPGEPLSINFDSDVRPILSDRCFFCHGPDANHREADLRLDTKDGIVADRGGYAVVVPHDADQSELIRRITTTDEAERMPPADTKLELTEQEVATLKQWIAAGAPWAGHWSFQPVRRPAIPAVDPPLTSWCRNPIDNFVAQRLRQEGLRPALEADRTTLLRRVTLDLTGVPPTPDEIDAFLADTAPDAYDRVVSRLLQSPTYGERMAWDWLDAARYADSNGYQGDNDRTMWPWRDWVINAFNNNLPYDQFTIHQLAGDKLPDATFQQQLATGFCRNHMINGEGGRIAEENRIEYLFDQTETLGTIWLGLTLTCCRCHDHKYDPVTRKEYYQLFAFFNQTPIDGRGGDPKTPPILDVPTEEQREQSQELAQRIATLKSKVGSIIPEDGAAEDDASKNAREELKKLEDDKKRIDDQIAKVMVMRDRDEPRQTFMLSKGLYNQTEGEVHADVPASLPALPVDASRDRLALARWLVSREHPLTARVTVNRMWQMFFGIGLVKTPEDFGSQGEKPTHPELLDWLAAEFMESGWDVKAMHRMIVTSATYRQSASATAELRQRDPDNRLLARGPRRRMPSWMIRDHALAASGLLVSKIGGPSVFPYQPEGVWQEATFGKKTYEPDHGEGLYRRSLYTFWRRIVGPTMLFDTAPRQTCVVKTTTTNSPLHALVTLNDITYVEAARAMAQRVWHVGDREHLQETHDHDRIQSAFRLATTRIPDDKEVTLIAERLNRLRDTYSTDEESAKKLLAIGEATRDESIPVAEHAAWTTVCLMLLNTDEALSR
ncbi:MAG: DUF1553 domain-containing protein [Pirellulaceae bacterium]